MYIEIFWKNPTLGEKVFTMFVWFLVLALIIALIVSVFKTGKRTTKILNTLSRDKLISKIEDSKLTKIILEKNDVKALIIDGELLSVEKTSKGKVIFFKDTYLKKAAYLYFEAKIVPIVVLEDSYYIFNFKNDDEIQFSKVKKEELVAAANASFDLYNSNAKLLSKLYKSTLQ